MREGGFTARKVIPADVRDAYSKLYGQRTEERLPNTGRMDVRLARAKHREWLSDIEARIANIRAERKGEGRTLTPKEARALAGEWYNWFVARAPSWPADVWGDYEAHMRSELYGPAMGADRDGRLVIDPARHQFSGDPLELWERDSGMRERVRPIIADEAKTSQFLAAKRLVLDEPSKAMFLDFATRDFFAAVAVLARRARGDHGPDKWVEQFPQYEGTADPSLTPWMLFERWIKSAEPADSTVDRWRGVFLKLKADFPNMNAAALLPEQAQAWTKGLLSENRSAYTVSNIWHCASRTVYAWAIDEKLLTRNPFTGWRIKVPKSTKTRETKSFTDTEIGLILNAALAAKMRGGARSKSDAAKRWCPWLAAYSGARMGELTQLRGDDIKEQDGVHAMKITPEAGTTKTRTTRMVPLHEHLVEQGFLEFVKASGKGPLFYNEPTGPSAEVDPTNPRKPRSAKTREHLAEWVRKLGVNDPELSPNHAWRHSFKAIGDRAGISEKVLDAIVGHAPASIGRGYGEPTLADKAQELRKFPRYKRAA
jgi:integrase